MAEHFVLLADLVDSRRVEDRDGFERRLRGALDSAGRLPGVGWHAPLDAVKGIDELSSAILTPELAFDVAWTVNLEVWPERFRFALGFGTVDIGLETHRAGPMDGPAYHRTAAAVARAREQGIGFALALPNVSESAIRVVESLGHLHDLTMGRWSAREAEIVRAYQEHRQQTEVAARYDISQQAVSAALRRADDRALRRARAAMRDWLAFETNSTETYVHE